MTCVHSNNATNYDHDKVDDDGNITKIITPSRIIINNGPKDHKTCMVINGS